MSEVINTEGTLQYRHGEPVCLLSRSDRMQGHATLEYKGNVFSVYSMIKELYSIQLRSGSFIMGVGNPYYVREYREALSKEVAFDGDTYVWVRDCFNKCGIHTVEVPVMFEIKGCVRLTVGESGLWRLFMPDGQVQVGMGKEAAPDSPAMKAVSKKMTDFYSTRFMSYVSGLFSLLEPLEVEAPYEDTDSSSVEVASHKKNRRTNWLVHLIVKLRRFCGSFKFRFSRTRPLQVETTDLQYGSTRCSV
jgi:hypothetical protein